ncbi:MAG TPA: MBL fold metallo-hydrolase [Candidatus Acidoferrum sp.]|nr:MBL fold metallo-hydrolase [Candidatus Acidoferrum sp.]
MRHAGYARPGFIAGLCLALAMTSALAADPTADQLLDTALKALGGQQEGIVITAHGYDACLGQPWSVKQGWSRWELTDYHRTFDYRNGATKHNAQRRAGMDGEHIGGCGAQPNATAAPQQSLTDANAPWSDQLVLWLTPQGFLQLMAAGKPELARDSKGWQITVPMPRDGINYKLIGHLNANNEIDWVHTWLDDPVFGDMLVEAEFGHYKQYDGVKFPQSYTIKQGGSATLALTIDGASASSEAVVTTAPRRTFAALGDSGIAFTEVGKGVFVLGGSYQSVAVEFDQFSVVIDGLQNDSRAKQLIMFTKQAIPNKPIRYVVTTHAHFDHASGLRQFAAEGATIIAHKSDIDFYKQALAAPRTLRTKATEPNSVSAKLQAVDDHYVIEDKAGQKVELYALQPNLHAADMLIAYIPSTHTVVEADLLQPWISPQFGGKNGPHPLLVYLDQELTRLKLDYQNFVSVHAPPNPPLMQKADLQAALGKH